jgi:GTP-binding protein Era
MPKAHPNHSAPDDGSNSNASAQSPSDGGQPLSPAAAPRAGFVALIGRPNVGKSTLMNCILGEKLAIVSPKPQTTRTRLLGIKNLPGVQLALVDTPGMHRPDGRGRTLLNRFMVDEAQTALADVDVVLLITDLDVQRAQKAAPPDPEPEPRPQGKGSAEGPLDEATRAVRALLHPADRYVVQQLGSCGKPLVLAINKVDLLRDKKLLLPLIEEWNKLQNFRAIVPICAARGEGVDQLLAVLSAAVPAGEPLFPPEMLTDRAERFLVAELVREQVFLASRQELPYSVAVTIDSWEERVAPKGHRAGDRIGVIIDATVHVEKANQKKIIVGEGGHMIRDIGAAARAAISELLGCGVHLALFVRVDEEWTASPAGLRKMGYEAPTNLGQAAASTARRPTPPRRADGPKGKAAQPPSRGREQRGSRPLPSSHTSHAGPGEHAK